MKKPGKKQSAQMAALDRRIAAVRALERYAADAAGEADYWDAIGGVLVVRRGLERGHFKNWGELPEHARQAHRAKHERAIRAVFKLLDDAGALRWERAERAVRVTAEGMEAWRTESYALAK